MRIQSLVQSLCLSLPLALALAPAHLLAQAESLSSDAVFRGAGAGGPFDPPGNLWDNGQNNNATSLTSQDSSSTFTARSADDFILSAECASGEFAISRIRTHMVQADTAVQPQAVNLFADDGSGNFPTAGITPIATVPQSAAALLNSFGAGTSMYEVTHLPVDLVLQANTRYWISGFGTDELANASGFRVFFASSNGAPGTTANGVIIAPGASVPNWTETDAVIGPPRLAFSFAIDGECVPVEADLSVSLVDAPDPVNAGENLTYTVTATNNGPFDADNVSITLPLPAGTSFVSADAGADAVCNAASPVVCTWADPIANTASRVATIIVLVDAAIIGTLEATVTVSSDTTDPDPGNNSADATTTVRRVGGSYDPPGTLWDNGYNNNTTSLASQDSSGTLTARSADDFILTAECESGEFAISRIRTHMVQVDAAVQPQAVNLFADDGSGNFPTAGITPIASVPESAAALLNPFGAGTSMYEVTYLPVDLVLDANTRYWISGFGTDELANASSFRAFFAASDGAPETNANGVIIAPGAGVPDWTATDAVIGPPRLAFSFAIDGECVTSTADLQIAKESSANEAQDGQVIVYAITVANAGPQAVVGAVLADVLPAELAGAEWACLPDESNTACPPPPFDAGTGDLYAEIDLPVDGFLRYDLSATVQAGAGATVSNTATVETPDGVDELDSDNNSATSSVLIVPEGIFANGFEAIVRSLTVPAAAKAHKEAVRRQ